MATARFARPTNRLRAVEEFYCSALGLSKLGAFTGHDGFDGVMLGYPGADWHLEFTSEMGVSAVPCPSAEHLLVLYLQPPEFSRIRERMEDRGIKPVGSHNPYWEKSGAVTVEDPDGYGVVLFPEGGRA